MDDVTEMVTTVHNIRFSNGRGSKDHRVAILNIYRLNHKNATGTSLGELKRAIEKQVRTLELQGIRKVLVHGDFNNENLSISGFTELNHKGMYHKHKEGAAKRYIDKVFANFAEVAVLEAYPSCENREQNLEEDIGHKSILIRIGRVPRKVIEHKFANQKISRRELGS